MENTFNINDYKIDKMYKKPNKKIKMYHKTIHMNVIAYVKKIRFFLY